MDEMMKTNGSTAGSVRECARHSDSGGVKMSSYSALSYKRGKE